MTVWGIHLLWDFDMEFMAMWYLLLLFADVGHGKELCLCSDGKRRGLSVLSGLVGVMAAVSWGGDDSKICRKSGYQFCHASVLYGE